jgi:hypothetical protein
MKRSDGWMKSAVRVACCVVAAALVWSGCGGATETPNQGTSTPSTVDGSSAEERQVARVIERLEDAIRRADARRACTRILARETTGRRCIDDLGLVLRHPMYRRFEITVRDVTLNDGRATARVVLRIRGEAGGERETYRLVREGSEWRVALRLGG